VPRLSARRAASAPTALPAEIAEAGAFSASMANAAFSPIRAYFEGRSATRMSCAAVAIAASIEAPGSACFISSSG